VRLAAFDLGAFLVAQVVGKQAALRLDHKVKSLVIILLDQYCPISGSSTGAQFHALAVYYKIAFPKMVKACNLIREVLLEQIQSRQKMVRGMVK